MPQTEEMSRRTFLKLLTRGVAAGTAAVILGPSDSDVRPIDTPESSHEVIKKRVVEFTAQGLEFRAVFLVRGLSTALSHQTLTSQDLGNHKCLIVDAGQNDYTVDDNAIQLSNKMFGRGQNYFGFDGDIFEDGRSVVFVDITPKNSSSHSCRLDFRTWSTLSRNSHKSSFREK